ncbi:Cell morphogenesis protein PAG1 [Gonapodya sp. JEL0774]|nr:Cell morphogenesis protein PAG1 [Gonapodya sp. JEL0774]
MSAEKAPKITGFVPRSFALPNKDEITLATLKKAIPSHCFERSVMISFQYLMQDCAIMAALWWFAHEILDGGSFGGGGGVLEGYPFLVRASVWALWQFAAGAVMFGLWIVAHDEAFVPPNRTQHLGKPISKGSAEAMYYDTDKEREALPADDKGVLSTRWGNLLALVTMWTVAFPLYLLTHIQGRDYGRFTNHYDPMSPLFLPKQRILIVASDLGILAVLLACGQWARVAGISVVARYYIIPYLWTNFWLTTITLLQHTDSRLPHYKDTEWSYIRGALCTVDRDFGIFNHIHHNIADTHIAHHLFPTIPHYHATEATYHLRKVLEPAGLYTHDEGSWLYAAWSAYRNCRFVEDEGRATSGSAQQTSPVTRKSIDQPGRRTAGGGRLRSTSLPGVPISSVPDTDDEAGSSVPKEVERPNPFAGFSFEAAAKAPSNGASASSYGARDRDREEGHNSHTRESTAETHHGGSSAGGRKGPTWLVLQDLMSEFVRMAEIKSASVLALSVTDRDPDLSIHIRPGVDPAFDRVVGSLGRMSRHYPKLVLDSIMVWRKTKSESAEEQSDWESDTSSMISGRRSLDERNRSMLKERRSLVANFILCRALHEIIRNNEANPRGFPPDLGAKFEDMLFGQLINSDPELLAISPNRQANFEMFAQVIGVLSKIRFSSVADKFTAELPKLVQAKEGKLELFLSATRFLSLKLYPVEALEESADFIETLAHHFHNAHTQRTKHAYAEVLVELLEPIGAQATADVNVQQWAKAVEALYSRTLKLAGKPRHYSVAVPLLATVLSVAPKALFLNNWGTFVDFFLTRLKEKTLTIRRLALTCLSRVVWVYLFRCGEASLSNVQKKLEHIFRYLLPPRRRDVYPQETPGTVEVLSRMIAYVGNKHWDTLMLPGTMATMATTAMSYGVPSGTYATGISFAPSSIAPSIMSSLDDGTDPTLAPERMVAALRGFMMMLADVETAAVASINEVLPSRSRAESVGSNGKGLSGRMVIPVPTFPGLLSETDLKPSNFAKFGSGDWEFLRRASAALSLGASSERSLTASSNSPVVKQSTFTGIFPDGDEAVPIPAGALSSMVSDRMGFSALDSLNTVNVLLGRLLLNVDLSVGGMLVLLNSNLWSGVNRDRERDENHRLSMASSVSNSSGGRESFASSRTSVKRVSSGPGSESSFDLSGASPPTQSILPGAVPLKKAPHIELAKTIISCVPRCCPTSLTPELVVDLLSKYLLHADEGIRKASSAALIRISKIEEVGGDAAWWVNDRIDDTENSRSRTPSMSGPRFQWNSVEEMVARVCTESLLSFESEHMPEFVFLLGRSDDFDSEGTGNLFDNGYKTIVQLSELWAAERKDAFESMSNDVDSALSPRDPDIVNLAIEEIESWGLTLLFGPLPPVRKYGLQLLRIAANLMDDTLGPPPSPPAFLASPLIGGIDLKSPFGNYITNRELRIIHIMELFSDELVEKHFKGISASVVAGEAAKLQEVARRSRLSGKQGLAAVAMSEDQQDAGIWNRCVSDLAVLFVKHGSKEVLTNTLTRIGRRIVQMMPHIVAAADQTTPPPEKSTSAIVTWATTPYRVLVPLTKFGSQPQMAVPPATDDMVQQWKTCLIFAMAALDFVSPKSAEGLQWESALRRDQFIGLAAAATTTRSSITSSKALFQLVLPLLSTEKLSIRGGIITALGCVTISNYYPLFQELQPLMAVIADDHHQRFGGSAMEQGFGQRMPMTVSQQPRPRSTSGLLALASSSSQMNAAAKKIERLRTEVAHLFSLTSCFVMDDKCRKDPAVLSSVAQYIIQGSRFLSDPTVQTDWTFLLYRYHFCSLVEKLYKLCSPSSIPEEQHPQFLNLESHFTVEIRGTTAEVRIRELFSSEMRHLLFKLAESWCGHGPMGPLTLARDTRTINTAIEIIRDPRERSNLAITMHEQRQLLEYAALKCMTVLLRGPLVATERNSETSGRDENAMRRKGRHSKNVSEGGNNDDLRTAATLVDATDEFPKVKGSDQTIQAIGRTALKALIESSKDDGALIVRLMKHCYVPGNAIFDRACFTGLADAMSTIEDFRCRLVRQMALALTKVGDENIVVRKSALKLIGSVQTRLLGDELPSSGNVRSPPVTMDDSEYTLACAALPGDSEAIQRLFSVRLAMSHPEQSLEMMSEFFYWLDVIDSASIAPVHTKTKEAVIRLMLRMLVPWIRNLNLANPAQLTVFMAAYSHKSDPTLEEFQKNVTDGVLTNFLVLTVRHMDRFPTEVEALWRNWLEDLSTMDLGIRAYQSLNSVVDDDADVWSRGPGGAEAHLAMLLDFLLTIGTSVRNNVFLSLARHIVAIAVKSRVGLVHLVQKLVSEITIKNFLPPKLTADRGQQEPEDADIPQGTVRTFALSALTDSSAASKPSTIPPNRYLYVADLDRELVSTPRRPPYSRAQLATMLMRDSTYDLGSEVFLEYLPILVHTCVVHFDAPVTVISEDMKTFFFHLFQTIVPSSVAGASILSKRLEDSRGQRLWANEDLTPNTTTESVPSNAELTEFVNLVESVLVAVDEDFGQKWGEVALLWSTTSSIRHTACRSLEVFRAIMPAVTLDMLGDFLGRLGKTVGARSDEAQGFALEALNTLRAMVEPLQRDEILQFPQFFWACVATLESPHEWEFLRAAEILEKILRKMDLKDVQAMDMLRGTIPRDWQGGFPGLQPLLLKGLSSSVTEPVSLTLLNYLLRLDHTIVDASSGRVLFGLLANLPRMLNRYDASPEQEVLKEEASWNIEGDLAALAREKGFDAIGKQLSLVIRTKFRTKSEYLAFIIKGIEESYFPAFELPTLRFVLGLLGNSKEIYRRNSLQILKLLIPRIDLSQYMDLIMVEDGLLTPILDLLRSDLASEVLEVLDALLGQDDLSDTRYIFSARKMQKICRNVNPFDGPNPVSSTSRSDSKEEEVNLATGWRVHDRQKVSEVVKHNLGVVASTAYTNDPEDEEQGFLSSGTFSRLNRSSASLPQSEVGSAGPEPVVERVDITNTLMQNLDEFYSTVTSRINALDSPPMPRHQQDSGGGSKEESRASTRPETPSRGGGGG